MYNMTNIFASVISDKGLHRLNNEDNFYIDGKSMLEGGEDHIEVNITKKITCQYFSVYDGMGGEKSGEKASFTAVKVLSALDSKKDTKQTIEHEIIRISSYVEQTNNAIYMMSATEHENLRMGTTFAGLVICDGKAVTANLGDSRIYLLRKGLLKQLSTDHTEGERLVRLGIITPEQLKSHKSKHTLNRHFGVSPEEGTMEADFSEIIQLQKGDRFLLCSDGLTDMVEDKRMIELLLNSKDAEEVCKKLTKEALNNGGKDNVTTMVIEIISVYHENYLVILRQKPKIIIGLFILAFMVVFAVIFLSYFSNKYEFIPTLTVTPTKTATSTVKPNARPTVTSTTAPTTTATTEPTAIPNTTEQSTNTNLLSTLIP